MPPLYHLSIRLTRLHRFRNETLGSPERERVLSRLPGAEGGTGQKPTSLSCNSRVPMLKPPPRVKQFDFFMPNMLCCWPLGTFVVTTTEDSMKVTTFSPLVLALMLVVLVPATKVFATFLDITNDPVTVTYDVATYAVAGTNDAGIVGSMTVTNECVRRGDARYGCRVAPARRRHLRVKEMALLLAL